MKDTLTAKKLLPYTAYSHEQLASELKTDLQKGLSASEVAGRQEQYGLNELPEVYHSWWGILLKQLVSPFIYILLVVAGVTWALNDMGNSIIILACVMLNTMVGFIQEYKAHQSMDFLKNYIVNKVTVVREGTEQEVPSNQLVPGDIVYLFPGILFLPICA